MSAHRTDVVSASEIASWAYCPESWRLAAIGLPPNNQAAVSRGVALHTRTAAVDVWSRRGRTLGRWLLVMAVVAAALGYLFFAGAER